MRFPKIALLAVQLLGLVLCVFLVAITFVNPAQVEERLQQFAIAKVETSAEIAKATVSDSKLGAALKSGGKFEALGARFASEAREFDELRKQLVPALLAQSVSDRCNENCEFWAHAAVVSNHVLVQEIQNRRVGQQSLKEFAVQRYESAVIGLRNDLRRFGLVNVVVLTLMIGLVLMRNLLNWRFTAFSVALTGYVGWASYGYIFKQNWAMAILFQDWAGPGYQIGMVFTAILFFDWLFLRAWLTNAVLSLIAILLPS